MTKTVVGLYEDYQTAERVVRDLVNSGFSREKISVAARDQTGGKLAGAEDTQQGSKAGEHAAAGAGAGAVLGGIAGLVVGLGALAIPGIGPIIAAGPLATTLAGAGIGAAAGGLIGALTGAGVPEEDARAYSEGVRQGGTLVMVSAPDERAGQASDIMNRYNPVDVHTRYGRGDAAQGTATQQARTADTRATTDDEEMHEVGVGPETTGEGQTNIPVVEEEMRVGKRQVNAGGVRVRSYVTEEPVEETQQVRNENVNVERRPVDRPAADEDLDTAFQEQTFEVNQTREELVADKQAHVVEEVVISKDVDEHPETVRDTVRRTQVETENLGSDTSRSAPADRQQSATGVNRTGPVDFAEYEPDFRSHYETRYATRGRDYDYYEPAYRYGYNLAENPTYGEQDWSQIEADARRNWERTNPSTRWEDFRDGVRYAWERSRSGSQNYGGPDAGASSSGSFR